MAKEELAAVLRAPNQLCYCVCFFTLFVTYFVHIVSATISYARKEHLDIKTVITHLVLDKDFPSGCEGFTSDTRQGPNPRHSHEKETKI
jgi:hypothetical protein